MKKLGMPVVTHQLVKPIFLDLSNETTIRTFLRENPKNQQINQQYHIDKMPKKYLCPD